jgi:hypothetical protein
MHKMPLDGVYTVENMEVLNCHILNDMQMFMMNARTLL